MTNFRELRSIELSTLDHIEAMVAASWSGVTVVKSFNESYKAELPVICVSQGSVMPVKAGIGDNSLDKTITVNIDIFATSKGQMLDLVDFLLEDVLKDGWVYSTYSKGTGETLNTVVAGRIRVLRYVDLRPLDFEENGDRYDKFRYFISIEVGANAA